MSYIPLLLDVLQRVGVTPPDGACASELLELAIRSGAEWTESSGGWPCACCGQETAYIVHRVDRAARHFVEVTGCSTCDITFGENVVLRA